MASFRIFPKIDTPFAGYQLIYGSLTLHGKWLNNIFWLFSQLPWLPAFCSTWLMPPEVCLIWVISSHEFSIFFSSFEFCETFMLRKRCMRNLTSYFGRTLWPAKMMRKFLCFALQPLFLSLWKGTGLNLSTLERKKLSAQSRVTL